VNRNSAFVLLSFAILQYFLGLLLLTIFSSNTIVEGYSRQETLIVELREGARAADAARLIDAMSSDFGIGSNFIEYISPDQAINLYISDKSSIEALDGSNPFLPILVVHLPAEESTRDFTEKYIGEELVSEIISSKSISSDIGKQLNQTKLWLLGLFALLLVIVVIIIYQFLALTLHKEQSVINLKLLSGAYERQVLGPFISGSTRNAVLSTMIAIVMIALTILVVTPLKMLFQYVNSFTIATSILSLIVIGIVIYTISTYMIVKLYLRNHRNMH